MSAQSRPTCVYSEGLAQTERLALHAMQSSSNDSPLPRLLYWGGSNSDFQLKAAVFSSPLVIAFNVLSYEPRDFGRSDAPLFNWSMEDYARDAIALLDAVEWQSVFIVGESFGAMTAMESAIHFPERVKKLCLMATQIPNAEFLTFKGGHGFDQATPAPAKAIIDRWCTTTEENKYVC